MQYVYHRKGNYYRKGLLSLGVCLCFKNHNKFIYIHYSIVIKRTLNIMSVSKI